MRKVATLVLLLFSLNSFSKEPLELIFSTSCITKINIVKQKHFNYWDIVIDINREMAEKLKSFSAENIGKEVIYKNNNDEIFLEKPFTIYSEISTPFKIAYFQSKKEAEKSKEFILSTKGECKIGA